MMYPVRYHRQERTKGGKVTYALSCRDFEKYSAIMLVDEYGDTESNYSARKATIEQGPEFLRECIKQTILAKKWVPSGTLSLPKTKDDDYNVNDTVYVEVQLSVSIKAQIHNSVLSARQNYNRDKDQKHLNNNVSELSAIARDIQDTLYQEQSFVLECEFHYKEYNRDYER